MTTLQYEIFDQFRKEFKAQVAVWNNQIPNLAELQKAAADAQNTPSYPIETPVVYNTALDELTVDDDIRIIVIGDNPGKDEQLLKNNKYLVGQAGKIAQGYFAKNPELGIDFRKNAIILNKTPVHSAKTNQLKMIAKLGGPEVQKLLLESQIWMAQKTAQLHKNLCAAGGDGKVTELWLVGYSELTSKGIFGAYRDTLKATYAGECWDKVFVFQHFSMNRFTIDLREHYEKITAPEKLEDKIHQLGNFHKKEIFV